MRVKKATVTDAKTIHSLINKLAKKDEMLPRSLNDVYENIRDFFVCKDGMTILGVSALHVLWEDLAEIRSIAVLKAHQQKGIGRKLIAKCLKEAKALGIKKVFALTYDPSFFKNFGFKDIDKNSLPQKIWGDCLKCPKFPECDEVAVIKTIR
ncbi:MAG TPA: N-acetyltransferase [Nitrospirae bacterium]|nr:amino-acid acetyltransferase [bacterium BMS3Abin10]GBE38160.1 amino-acid acetyltransferase [bacterium BMS3Bbin08]HDH01322.1 N-acetyltransferase [Nitrospirota bacterium]HDK81986.1 N-acetyltransferase [Nitrospirota bacterium]HDO26343.1 N-acetyltransferase [Nitrospirota bacterium]